MRVCMLNDNYYRGSGVTKAIQRIVQSPPFGEVEVYLAGAAKLDGCTSRYEETNFVPPDHYRYFPLMNVDGALPGTLVKFALWLRAMHFDVVHAHHRRLAVLANLITPLSRVPVLYTCHITFAPSKWFRELAPRRAIGNSPSTVEYLRRATKSSSISLIYNPVNVGCCHRPDDVLGRKCAVSLGRLDSRKGYEELIDAWKLLKNKGVSARLDIFGEGPLRETLVSRIERHDLGGDVRLLGFSSNASAQIANYAFNILVSSREGLPTVVMEAAAAGVPTLLTNVDGSRDALPESVELPNGLPFGDVDALADALCKWFSSPSLIRKDGTRFFNFMGPICSPEKIGMQYLEAYKGCFEPAV